MDGFNLLCWIAGLSAVYGSWWLAVRLGTADEVTSAYCARVDEELEAKGM